MTAHAVARSQWGAAAKTALLLAFLGTACVVRAAINGSSTESAFVGGLLFGLALAAGCVIASPAMTFAPPKPRQVVPGITTGALLVAVPLVLQPLRVSAFHPEPFPIWVAITCLVACAEEGFIRGQLLNTSTQAFGVVPAVIVTSIAFALMHVPLYGWQVFPVDLAAGVFLAGLRLSSGSVVAPAIAHTIADLATWWF
jgi:membrane protease YdiL (CAAX protease family)